MRKGLFRVFKKFMLITGIITAIFLLVTLLYMQQDLFGKKPKGARLEAIKKSPNFKDGQFQNINPTPQISEDHTMFGVLKDYIFKKFPKTVPVDTIPSVKTDLHKIPLNSNVLVWFGHSSYYMQIDGKRILVDPVFSGNASPIPKSVKSFEGSERYTVADLPNIDYLFISHDHYDHVDHKTLLQLQAKTNKVICGLGVGAHLEHWGYTETQIIEKDWHEVVPLASGFKATVTPARHFSGRAFSRNKTLWASYVLETPSIKVFIGGDSGYDSHYAEIGKKHGPIDLAIMENGQYNDAWRYIHHMPEQVLQAAKDLGAKRVFPVHSSKFKLANHPWNEPLQRIVKANEAHQLPLVTPIIGEVVNLNDSTQTFTHWWEGLE